MRIKTLYYKEYKVALRKSIEIWQKRTDGQIFRRDCPLCFVDKAYHPSCNFCPVCLVTGKTHCSATPFYKYRHAKTVKDSAGLIKHATEMVKLLKKVRKTYKKQYCKANCHEHS